MDWNMGNHVRMRTYIHKSTWVELQQYCDLYHGKVPNIVDRALKSWLKRRRKRSTVVDEKLKDVDVNRIQTMEFFQDRVDERILSSSPPPAPTPPQDMEIITSRMPGCSTAKGRRLHWTEKRL